jgi:hypothetical protein
MPSRALRLALLLALPVTGCSSTVIGGGGEGGSGSASGSPSAGPGAPTGGGAQASAIALYEAEMLEAGSEAHCDYERHYCASPDMLFLLVSSEGLGCSDPLARPEWGSPGWFMYIGLPLELQAVGTYDLASADDGIYITARQAQSSDMSGGVAAAGGFNPRFGGTLEILSMDDASVTFRLTGALVDSAGDGQYVAPRCGAATPPTGA